MQFRIYQGAFHPPYHTVALMSAELKLVVVVYLVAPVQLASFF